MQIDEESLYEQYEERAAIFEYDGGYSREDAERHSLNLFSPGKRAIVIDMIRRYGNGHLLGIGSGM